MHEPNVVGDWQEYDGDLIGLRVRVHDLKKIAKPSRLYDEDAVKGLSFFSFRVTFDNHAKEYFSIDLDEDNVQVRAGRDGEAAIVERRASQWINGFNVYPLRRVTTTIVAAAPAARLKTVDIQLQLMVDNDWAHRYVWVGGVGIPQASTSKAKRASTAKNSIASQVSRFLAEQAGSA
ncbi:hypothetical protein [Streptomyces yanii]|uniref:Uncharacterized protein n=1 Tax=Streptomyces yanii TaxID=78510 RepID=A0ABV5R7H3_9ACTN